MSQSTNIAANFNRVKTANSTQLKQLKPVNIDQDIDRLLSTDMDTILSMVDMHLQETTDGGTDQSLVRSLNMVYDVMSYSKKNKLTLNRLYEPISGICSGCVRVQKITKASPKFYPMLYQSCVDCYLEKIKMCLEGYNPVVVYNVEVAPQPYNYEPVKYQRITLDWYENHVLLSDAYNSVRIDRDEIQFIENHVSGCMFAQLGIPDLYFQDLGITDPVIIVNKSSNILCKTAFTSGKMCRQGIEFNLSGTRYTTSDAPFALSDKCSTCLDVTTGFIPNDIPEEFRANIGSVNYINSKIIEAKNEKIADLRASMPPVIYDMSEHVVTDDTDYSNYW